MELSTTTPTCASRIRRESYQPLNNGDGLLPSTNASFDDVCFFPVCGAKGKKCKMYMVMQCYDEGDVGGNTESGMYKL